MEWIILLLLVLWWMSRPIKPEKKRMKAKLARSGHYHIAGRYCAVCGVRVGEDTLICPNGHAVG